MQDTMHVTADTIWDQAFVQKAKRQAAGIKARELATKRKTACEILPTMIFL